MLTADTITDEQIRELHRRGNGRARTAARALNPADPMYRDARAFFAAVANDINLLDEKVTADTITDEHIAALYRDLMSRPEWGTSAELQRDAVTCQVALEYEVMHWTRDERAMKARARCAEILSARSKSQRQEEGEPELLGWQYGEFVGGDR